VRRLLAALVLMPAIAPAQVDHTAETVKFLRSAWASVQRDGPKQLDRLRCKWPDEVRRVRKEATDLQSKWSTKLGDADLKQRLALIAELWRIRSSIDLLALTSPASRSSRGWIRGNSPS
jgi:uncharacterized tellurite resistance protein B-like protein